MRPRVLTLAVLAAASPAALCAAQQSIDPAHKFSWSENCGWMNWSGAPGQAVTVGSTYLTGHIWCENVGWVSLSSSGAPADGQAFANTSDADYGVNIVPGWGTLSGFAWAENIGWINFSGGSHAVPPRPALLDPVAKRFRGFAWSENAGWINLDDAEHYVATGCGGCAADFDCNGFREVPDIFAFLSAWFAMDPRTDIDGVPGIGVPDIFAFLSLWFAGCP